MDVLMPDGTTITDVPEGITKAQLLAKYQGAQATNNAPQVPGISEGMSTLSQVPRQLGLTVRAGLGGLGGVANMVLDPATALVNKALAAAQPTKLSDLVTGQQPFQLPLPSQAMERTLSRFLPTPDTPMERIAQAGARAMVPVAGSVQAGRAIPALASLAEMPGTQLFSAASGGASSQGAAEAGAGPGGQALAGILGGVGGPTALMAANAAARAALRVPGSLLTPFTNNGQLNSAARVYQSAATNKNAALDALGGRPAPETQPAYRVALGYSSNPAPDFQLVPGTTPTTAEVANDNGLSGLYKTLLNNPQTRGPLQDSINNNDAARQAFLAQTFGGPADIRAAKEARTATTTPMRESAFSGATGPVDTTPIVAAGNKTLEAGAKYRGSGPLIEGFVNDIKGITDPQVLYNGPRKAISDAIEGRVSKDSPLATFTTAELINLRGLIDNQIEAVAPGFKNYLQTHAQLSRQIDAQQLGQNITGAATNDFRERLSGPIFSRQVGQNGPDIANMGAQGSDAITRVNEDLKRAGRPLEAVRAPGSDTIPNAAGNELFQRLIGHAPGGMVTRTLAKAASAVYAAPQDRIRELIVRGMVDPQFGASLLARRIPEKPNLTAGLLAQLLPISYGGLLGTMSAQ